MNFRHVLVASDLSHSVRQCYPHAAGLARHFGARLTVLHADESREADVSHGDLGQERAAAIAQVRADFAAMGVAVEVAEVAGEAKKVIDGYVRAHDVDLIVIGKRSRGAIGDLFMGATANRVLRLVDVPILVVPIADPTAEPVLDELPRYRAVVAATDLGATSLRGLGATVELAKALDARITAVYVLNWAAVTPAFIGGAAVTVTEDQMQALREAHAEKMQLHVGELGETRIDTRVVVAENTPTALVEIADALEADLVAIPTTGKGALKRIFLGSTTERLIKRAHLPVLALPATWLAHRAE